VYFDQNHLVFPGISAGYVPAQDTERKLKYTRTLAYRPTDICTTNRNFCDSFPVRYINLVRQPVTEHGGEAISNFFRCSEGPLFKPWHQDKLPFIDFTSISPGKDIIWNSRTTNNQREAKQTLLCQHLFLFVFGGIATCFDPFLGSSSGLKQMLRP
jgi:hypothetical protein